MNTVTDTFLKPFKTIAELTNCKKTKTDNEKAFNKGRNEARLNLLHGRAVYLIEENKPFLSGTDTSWRIGWNSIVFTQENRTLLNKAKKNQTKHIAKKRISQYY